AEAPGLHRPSSLPPTTAERFSRHARGHAGVHRASADNRRVAVYGSRLRTGDQGALHLARRGTLHGRESSAPRQDAEDTPLRRPAARRGAGGTAPFGDQPADERWHPGSRDPSPPPRHWYAIGRDRRAHSGRGTIGSQEWNAAGLRKGITRALRPRRCHGAECAQTLYTSAPTGILYRRTLPGRAEGGSHRRGDT